MSFTIKDCTVFKIEDKDYITITDFCFLVGRSRTAVNNMIRFGNKHRKLECLRLHGKKTFIPVTEYFLFPFTEGNCRNSVYNFNALGEKIPNEKMNALLANKE
jgi:hypothetical protein